MTRPGDDDAPLRVHEHLLTEGWACAADEPSAAAALLGRAALAALNGGDVSAAISAGRDAREVAARGDEHAAAFASLALGTALLFAEQATAAEPLLTEALASLRSGDGSPPWQPLYQSAVMLYWLERNDEAAKVLRLVIRRARKDRQHDALPVTLDTLAAIEFRAGAWDAADAHSTEGLRIARRLDNRFQIASGLTTLARLAAVRGPEAECRELLAEARSVLPRNRITLNYAHSAGGLLELGLGNIDAARREFQALDELPASNPQIVQWEPDLIETLARGRRRSDAEAALRRFEERSARSGRSWGLASAARCRGLLAPDDDIETPFAEALKLHAQAVMPFERARTELCFGERLRRAGKIRESALHLATALEIFETLRAAPWAERTRRELAPRRRGRTASSPVSLLTTHEQQVVRLVQRGATNREAAAELFVSPKTVEYHLSNAYGKLGLRSRTELVLLLARPRQL